MENHLADQTMTLSINISCCEECPKILKKKLLKMPGVDSVAIDTENNLVFVRGAVDPTTLLNNIEKLGKTAQLLPTDKHSKNHVEEKHYYTTNEGRDNSFTARKMHKNCRYQDGRHNHKKEIEEKQEEHKCEAYVAPNVDERICRDYYCKIHPRSYKIVDRVPAENSTLFGFGGLPFYGGFGPLWRRFIFVSGVVQGRVTALRVWPAAEDAPTISIPVPIECSCVQEDSSKNQYSSLFTSFFSSLRKKL